MSRKNTCVLLYPNDQDARQAVEKLQTQHFNMKTVSIIGTHTADEQHHSGQPGAGEQVCFQGICGRQQKSLWPQLGGALFFILPDIGALITAGAIVDILKQAQESLDIGHGFTVLGRALFNMGIPADSVKQYEKDVRKEKILLTVNGARDDVEQACRILHNETQQATVHIA